MRIRSLSGGISLLVGLAAFGVLGKPLAAQATNASARVQIPYTSYLSLNPLGIPFDIFSIEGETGIAQGMTLGASVSHTEIDNQRYSSGDFKFRYYPSEVVLKGFSIGASAGLLRYSDIVNGADRATIDSPTIGLLLDYNWLLGATHRFVIGTGVAAKRILAGTEDRAKVDLGRAQLSARFTVGVAF